MDLRFYGGLLSTIAISLFGCSHQNLRSTTGVGSNTQSQSVKLKYNSEVALLSTSHEFIQSSPAPDYWVLAPYYIGQQTDSACSLATTVMIINASRVGKPMAHDEEMVTQQGLLKKLGDKDYTLAVAQEGSGVTLDQMKAIISRSLKVYGIEHFTIDAIHTSEISEEVQKRLRKILIENEHTSQNFIVANFNQGIYTGDTQVGHMAPIGAYDQKNKRVLIFDPDRQWYEPYWISEDTFLKGLATQDPESGQSRGYLWIQLLR